MFIGITDAKKLEYLQRQFQKQLSLFETENVETIVGHQGANWHEKVSYSSALDLWWTLNKANKKPQYWNVFGLGKPEPNRVSRMIVEINYPTSGVNFRVAGNWAVDEEKNFYLVHSGKIGGGQRGIGKFLFEDKYLGEFIVLEVGGYTRKSALIAGLNDENFCYQIKEFVHVINAIKTGSEIHNPITFPFAFNREFEGERIYGLPERVKATCNHGIIVNTLQNVLRKKGKKTGNNGASGRMDLFVYDNESVIQEVYEIKPDLSLQAIYKAIGQLLMYTYPLTPKPKMYLVCPDTLTKRVREMLLTLKIKTVEYSWRKGKPIFDL